MPSQFINRRGLRAASALALVLGTGLTVPIALAGTAGAAALPATAAVNEYGWQLTYTAAVGQTNKVAITESYTSDRTGIVYVIDDVLPVSAGSGCVHPVDTDRTKVSCTVALVDSQDPYAALQMDLGNGNDTVISKNTTRQVYSYNRIDLGTGNDKVTDNLGLDGNDINGGPGDDTISVGKLALVVGGDGNDTVYANGDYIIAQGGKGNDVIHGGSDHQDLTGDDGNDTLYGGPADDSLYGGKGNDVLYGNSGNDTLYGNSGNDTLYGGPGRDKLSGGPGRNTLHQG
ncbi:calcium-binding protein [Streptomyces sp. NPDC059582]|uniref:calcium-binding protein n=1 Tax=Streptomyces sp. NPDC059582 TaxID=3346875 RepID=UPI003683D872